MKFSNLLLLAGLSVVGVSAQGFAAAQMCPENFSVKHSHCNCTSKETITCTPGGELLYKHKFGVDISKKMLTTKSGATVTCDGNTWGVRIVSGHIGFRCVK